MILRTSRRPTRRAVTAVETAIVLTTVVIMLLAIVEYGRFLMVRQLAENAAREGARQAVAGTTVYTTSNIQNTVVQYLAGVPLQNTSGQALQASDIQVYRADATTGNANATDSDWTHASYGEAIAVKIDARYKPILPTLGLLPSLAPVKTTAVMLSEAN
jgi:Flp pilus assembly protein TadG